MYSLNCFTVVSTRRVIAPSASPMFSTAPCGSYSIVRLTRVRSAPTGSKRTVPPFGASGVVLRQEIFWSGTCSTISASHSLSLPQIAARQCWCVVELLHLLHSRHELRELLELRPLVVDGAHGAAHLDALLDPFHG